jgi:Leucine-rich repeat (LRR) protein
MDIPTKTKVIAMLIVLLMLVGVYFSSLAIVPHSAKIDTVNVEESEGDQQVNDDETPVLIDDASNIIDMSNQGLTTVPENIFSSTRVTILDLSGNKLTGSLPAEIRHLSDLRELNLSNNDFTGVPAEVGQLVNLRVLNLSGNPITGLPYEIGNLGKLELLDVRNTQYSVQDLEVIMRSLPASVKILR